jgi:hypothetical protein
MKFDQIKHEESHKSITHSIKNSGDQSEENIADIKLYENVAVYLMKPGTKGNFRYISTLANNGESPISWSIRVFFTAGKWNAQIAPHSEIDKALIDIDVASIVQKFESPEIESLANLHFGNIRSSSEKAVQDAVNFLIENFKDKKLLGIETYKVFPNYTLEETNSTYEILYDLKPVDPQSEKFSHNKYAAIYRTLAQKNLSEKDTFAFKRISVSRLNEFDKLALLNLSQKYLSQAERIKIAMKFIEESKRMI